MNLSGAMRGLVPASLVRCLPASRRRKYIRASVARRNFLRLPRLMGHSDPFPTGTLFSAIGLLLTDGQDALIPQLSALGQPAEPFEAAIFSALVLHGEGDRAAAQDNLLRAGNDPAFDPYLRMCARAWALFLRMPRLEPAPPARGPAILQYWDTETVPGDVSTEMAHWRALAGDAYTALNAPLARAFLSAEFGPAALSVFDACAHPAIQSDYIRLAWLARHGGVYIDADARMRGGFRTLWPAMVERTVLWFYAHSAKGHFTNGVLAAPAGSKLVTACFEETGRRILADPMGHVYALGGPGMLTDMALACDCAGGLDDGAALTTDQVRRDVMTQIDAAYKSGERSWHVWQKSKPWEQGT